MRSALTRHSSCAPESGGRAPVRPVEEVPVGDQQPVLVQPAVELAGQRLLPGALARDTAHRRVRYHMRGALADRDHPHLRVRRPARVISPGAGEPERGRVLRRIRGVPLEPVNRHQPPRPQERPGGQLLRHRGRHLGEQLFHRLVSQPLAGLGDPARRPARSTNHPSSPTPSASRSAGPRLPHSHPRRKEPAPSRNRPSRAAGASRPTASPASRPPRPRHRPHPAARTRPAPPATPSPSAGRPQSPRHCLP